MAAQGHDWLTAHGYAAVGFDHFAIAGRDPLALAAANGSLHRNFQGFTDDDAPNLIGLGASAISSFPTLLAQNEKNSGQYRTLFSQGLLATTRGLGRTNDDPARGPGIAGLLSRGSARLGRRAGFQVPAAPRP